MDRSGDYHITTDFAMPGGSGSAVGSITVPGNMVVPLSGWVSTTDIPVSAGGGDILIVQAKSDLSPNRVIGGVFFSIRDGTSPDVSWAIEYTCSFTAERTSPTNVRVTARIYPLFGIRPRTSTPETVTFFINNMIAP